MSDLTGALALGQLGKVEMITQHMRDAKWKIRARIKDLPGLGFRNIVDPDGDSGSFLITLYPSPDICQHFIVALKAEGIKGPDGSLTCITMREWGMHWYFNVPSLVKKRSWSRDGFPWTHPANSFARDYSYDKGALPMCDAMSERAALLTIASVLTEEDIDDIVAAFHKVGRVLLPDFELRSS